MKYIQNISLLNLLWVCPYICLNELTIQYVGLA